VTTATRISFPAHVDFRSRYVVNVHVVKRFDNTLHLLGTESTEIRIDERSGTTSVKSHIFSRVLPRNSVMASFTRTRQEEFERFDIS